MSRKTWAARGIFNVSVGVALLVGSAVVLVTSMVSGELTEGDNTAWLILAIVGLAVLGGSIIEKNRREGILKPKDKKCPQCAELVKAEAKKCRFCGHEFKPAAPSP